MTWGSRCFEKFGPGCLWWSPAYRDWLRTETEELTTGGGAVVPIQQHQAEAFRKVKTGIKETMHSEALKSHHLLAGMVTTEVAQTDSNLGFDWQRAASDSAQTAARFKSPNETGFTIGRSPGCETTRVPPEQIDQRFNWLTNHSCSSTST